MGALASCFEGREEKHAGYKECKYFAFANSPIWTETNVTPEPAPILWPPPRHLCKAMIR